MSVFVDTHCHLDAAEFDADRDAVVAAAHARGVAALVLPAVEVANFETVRTLAHRFPGGTYALGIHPMYVDRADDDALAALERALEAHRADPRLVAVGEIGLDGFVPGLDRERQDAFLKAQLRLARAFDLPVILHVRKAQDAVLAQLRRAGVNRGIAHAFNGSFQQATAWIEQGFALGFGGAMTFTRALRIRDLARQLPAGSLVLETDAPDIAPEWIARERNSPAELPRVAQVLAQLRGRTLEEVAAGTTENAQRVLPRLRAVMAQATMSRPSDDHRRV